MKELRRKRKLILKRTIKRVVGPGETFLGFRLNKGKFNQLWRWDSLENC